MNQYNPYYNPYLSPTPIQQNIGYNQQNVLPPQQILQVSGKSSIEALKMSPNSSVLIADSQKPLIYKCISDGLGNCSIETYDVSLHKDEEKVEQENLAAMVHDLRMRIERLEHEQSNSFRNAATHNNAESTTNEENPANDEVHVES